MNRNQAKALLPIIQAYAEGKAIESRCVKGDKSLWYNDEDPSFDNDFEYRIKQEPRYRPFRDSKECWEEMQKHKPFGWVKNKTSTQMYRVCDITESTDWDYRFSTFMFIDGTPYGIKEE